MLNKAQTYAQVAEDTAKDLTRSLVDWTGFLTTAGRLYKYPYHDFLMNLIARKIEDAIGEFYQSAINSNMIKEYTVEPLL